MPMGGADGAPSDDQVLSWCNQAHDERAVAVTPEIVSAYTRQVVHPQKLARFDAEIAKLLGPAVWASIAERLRPSALPAEGREGT